MFSLYKMELKLRDRIRLELVLKHFSLSLMWFLGFRNDKTYKYLKEKVSFDKLIYQALSHKLTLNMSGSSSWITKELLQEVVDNDPHFTKSSSPVRIESFSLSSDLTKGYSSTLFRINLIFKKGHDSENHSYIAKTSLGAPQGALPFSHSNGIFSKENEVLGNLVPQFENLYRHEGVEVSFGPKVHKIISTSEYQAIIMEDLKPAGFKSSKESLDLNRALVCVTKIAQFHAASVVYCSRNGPLKEMFREREFGIEYFDSFYHHQMQSLLEEVKKWDGFEVEADILASYKSVVHRIYKLWCEVKAEDFAVLCHGDLHMNNVMFNVDSKDIKMVTFLLFYLEI